MANLLIAKKWHGYKVDLQVILLPQVYQLERKRFINTKLTIKINGLIS